MDDNIRYIPIRQAVKLTGICAQTLRKLCDENVINCYKTSSGQRKFDINSLNKMINNNSSNNSTYNTCNTSNTINTINTDITCK